MELGIRGTGLGILVLGLDGKRHWSGAYQTCELNVRGMTSGILDVGLDIKGTGLGHI